MVVSGLMLMLADVDAYLASRVFWLKMALVFGLVLNGAVLVRATGRAENGDAVATARLRFVSLASLVLWFATTLMGAVLPNVL